MRRLRVLLMLCSALVFASTVRAQGTAGTNNAELNGDYAFTFNGFSGSSGGPSRVFDAVGRFTADGAGNLTNGKLDTNGIGPGTTQVAQTFTGTYAIGSDHRGVMNIQGGAQFAFTMMANGNAQFIEFDASGGSGTIGSGTIEKADTTAYDSAKITGDYAFGAQSRRRFAHCRRQRRLHTNLRRKLLQGAQLRHCVRDVQCGRQWPDINRLRNL